LVRPLDLLDMVRARINGASYDAAAFESTLRNAVITIVREQAENGIDIVDDGEFSKPMFADYVVDRLSGFEGLNPSPDVAFVRGNNLPEPFPQYAAWRARQ